jgi:serine/threonine-protein kinase
MNTEVFECNNKGFSALTGELLKSKYRIGKFLASGENGHVFEVEGGMVAKFSLETREIAREIKITKTLQTKKCKNVAKIVDYGILILENFDQKKRVTCGYYIMPKYEQYPKVSCPFTMTRQLLSALEGLHNIGRVHNDLKPDNVLMEKNGGVVLIDYGLCQKF